ncbi:MAG: hypothetical protein ABI600_03370 [Luteolibacter sp.]
MKWFLCLLSFVALIWHPKIATATTQGVMDTIYFCDEASGHAHAFSEARNVVPF